MSKHISTANLIAGALLGGLAALAANLHAQPLYWRGEFVYFADSPAFTDCASGKRWPVATTGDYLALQRAYLHWQSAPTAPLLVNFDGRLEIREPMEGPAREHIIVDRFASVEPGNTCQMISTGKQKSAKTTHRIEGERLVPLGADSKPLASFSSVYLR